MRSRMGDLLSETQLRELSQQFGSVIPKKNRSLDDTAFQHLEQLLLRIIHTAASAKLSLAHGAAAWNALYGFLELSSLSSDARLRELSFASTTWISVFELFLSRSQNAKAKPLRQFLHTWTNLLSKQPDPAVQASLKEHAVTSTVTMVIDQNDFSLVKPAFQVLEHFLHKGVIVSFDIIREVARICTNGTESNNINVRISTEKSGELDPESLSPIEILSLIEAFALRVFEWLRYPDIAPIAGRLLQSFFKHSQGSKFRDSQPKIKAPLWVAPLREFLENEPSMFETCEAHVLPGLLDLSFNDTLAFLETLPVQALQEGNAESLTLLEIQLCLAALKISSNTPTGVTLGLARRYDATEVQYIASGLLPHPSSTIRTTALSLLTFTSSPINLSSIQCLTILQQFIPYYHAEVNPKVRNEFVALMEKFCDKLARAFVALHKYHFTDHQIKIPLHDAYGHLEVGDEHNVAHRLITAHSSFSRWYIRFLTSELQPSASYQRHISALKIFVTLLPIGMNATGSRSLFDPVTIVNDPFSSSHPQFFGSQLLRLLLDLVMDSFDDVRLIASSVLVTVLCRMHPWNINFIPHQTAPFMDANSTALCKMPLETYNTFINDALCRAQSILNLTGRADHADGLGRLYCLLHHSSKNNIEASEWSQNGWLIIEHLLKGLENDISVAKSDIRLAVKTAPLHGKLLAIRYIISSRSFHDLSDPSDSEWSARKAANDRILDCCTKIWEAVREILCFDSPEGYEESEEGDSSLDLGNGTNDTLSFCWRALKESSSLMNFMVTNISYSSSASGSGFRYEDFQKLGNLAFTQLAELRHRGAFSSVSLTFAACCRKCAQATQSSDPQIKQSLISRLPAHWYKSALKIIDENASTLTRRSAGIPAIVTGILSAFPTGEFFDNVILDLQAIADAPVGFSEKARDLRLPQVHALNCLKDVFTDALLGQASEPHIAGTLEISAGCLESTIWAIRNCGLMLFRALLSRLNGGTDAYSTRASSPHRRFSRQSYEKYPNLPNLIIKLLSQPSMVALDAVSSEGDSVSLSFQAQKVYPALEILERSGMPSEQRTTIREAIRLHMEGPVWAIRQKAAKTSALILDEAEFTDEIKQVLESKAASQNAVHGHLLYVRFIIARIGPKTADQCDKIFLLVTRSFKRFASKNNCPFTAAAFVEILADALEQLIQNKSITVRGNAVSLQIMLRQRSSGFTFISREDLPPCPSIVLLAQALKRCWALIEQVREPKLRGPSNTPLTARGASPFNSDSIRDQNGEISQGNPEKFDNQMRLTGTKLGLAYNQNHGDPMIWNAIGAWSCKLSFALDETSDLDTRLAAAESVAAFIATLRKQGFDNWVAPELLSVYLAIYNILLDDDEDVRDKGAATTSTLLSAALGKSQGSGFLLMPLAAGARLLDYLVTSYHTSIVLFSNGICRLTGASSSSNLVLIIPSSLSSNNPTGVCIHLRPARDMLHEFMHQSNTLFNEEKQNLFLDPAKESKTWASALISFLPSLNTPHKIIPGFSTWCLDALSALIEIIESQDRDGPLGWTYKVDVFVMGIRILAAVRVMVHCSLATEESDPTSAAREDCHALLQMLTRLRTVGEEKLVHGLWVGYAEEILDETGR